MLLQTFLYTGKCHSKIYCFRTSYHKC